MKKSISKKTAGLSQVSRWASRFLRTSGRASRLSRTSSRAVHLSRTRRGRGASSKRGRGSRRGLAGTRAVILVVIGLSMVVVVSAVVLQVLATPERRVRGQIEEIATKYYEDYFYTPVAEAAEVPMEEVLGKYAETGLSKVSLAQLLRYGEERHPGVAALVTKYCDEDDSAVTFYPEAPFRKTDYRAEYGLRCEF